MKKFKNVLLSILSIVLVAILSIGGTLAYLKSEDSDVNVMTMGNVKIEQLEYERVVDENGNWVSTGETDKYGYTPDKLQEFTQAKPLYPAVFADGAIKYDDRVSGHQQSWGQVGASGSLQLFDDSVKNVQDKMVFVKNTGKSDAYVRTWIAFEQGDITSENFSKIIKLNSDADETGVNEAGGNTHWICKTYGTNIEIDGNKYVVVEYIYVGAKNNKGILAPGAVSYPSLTQVYMTPEATNEDVEAIDGNGNGVYDILVLSQAVQTKGFADSKTALDTAFGAEHPWVPKTISTINWDDVQKAAAEKRVIIDLTNALGDEDQTIETSNSHITINGNGNKVIAGTILSNNTKGKYGLIIDGGSAVINDIDIETKGGGISAINGAKVIFNGNNLHVRTTNTSGRYNFYLEGNGSEVTINGGNFSFTTSPNNKRAYIYANPGTTVYVKGGTFGKASSRSGYEAGILGNGTVIITGGTFGFNPSNWVAAGYKAVQNGSTWTVVAE